MHCILRADRGHNFVRLDSEEFSSRKSDLGDAKVREKWLGL